MRAVSLLEFWTTSKVASQIQPGQFLQVSKIFLEFNLLKKQQDKELYGNCLMKQIKKINCSYTQSVAHTNTNNRQIF